MHGQLISLWPETWREIWLPLVDEPLGDDDEGIGSDVFCELYRELAKAKKSQPSVEQLASVLDNPEESRDAFSATAGADLAGERVLVAFFESTHEILDDFGGDPLANRYFTLLDAFIGKYNLRYDLRRPCTLCPTLSGVFSSLVQSLQSLAMGDPHLSGLMKEFENAVRDLRQGCTQGHIKTCIQKQVNVLEAMGRTYPRVRATTLGAICEQVDTWPHEKIKTAMKDIYGFTCDYPGIRHGGTPASALRDVDMRDLVAMSILLTGFAPYLHDGFDPELVYRGA